MNRIVLIGNGFDLAHGMPTRYHDFIDGYFRKFCEDCDPSKSSHSTTELSVAIDNKNIRFSFIHLFLGEVITSHKEFIEAINLFRRNKGPISLDFKNSFFKSICDKYRSSNYLWADIENDYFDELTGYIDGGRKETNIKNVKKFNAEVREVEKRLGEYLELVENKFIPRSEVKEIYEKIYSVIEPADIAISSKESFYNSLEYGVSDYVEAKGRDSLMVDYNFMLKSKVFPYPINLTLNDQFVKKNSSDGFVSVNDNNIQSLPKYFLLPNNVLMLNFNYTDTDSLYKTEISKHIHIHGELDESKDNPIILGFGDEFCEEYKQLENLRDNAFVEQMKSSRYLHTNNYREFLKFMEAEPYQVIIMGHSCGNTDRTLLRTLFEHDNCVSIKPYYYKSENGDNYNNIVMSISRLFSDKAKMRDRIVNKTQCEPLPQIRT